jgi:hypothetical protein
MASESEGATEGEGKVGGKERAIEKEKDDRPIKEMVILELHEAMKDHKWEQIEVDQYTTVKQVPPSQMPTISKKTSIEIPLQH